MNGVSSPPLGERNGSELTTQNHPHVISLLQLKLQLLRLFFCYLQIYKEQFCKRVSDDKDAINKNLAGQQQQTIKKNKLYYKENLFTSKIYLQIDSA